MLFGIIGLAVLVFGLEKLNKLEKEVESKQASEEGYEVYFSR